MAITTQTVKVDLNTGKVLPVVYAHQNDTNRAIQFEVYNENAPFSLSGYTVKFGYVSPKVNGAYTVIAGDDMASGSINGNIVTFNIPESYLAIAGDGLLTMIISGTGSSIRPVNIRFAVQTSADGSGVMAGASDFPDAWMDEKVYSWLDDHIDGIFTEEKFTDAVEDWLDDHPEATTTVQDGGITYAKLNAELKNYATPEFFGAVGDGVTDDTQAINSALSSGNHVLFGNGKTYKVSGGLYIQEGQTIDLNGSTIVSSAASMFMNFHSSDVTYGYDGIGNFEIKNGTIYGGEMLFGHGENIRVRDVNFRNSLGSHCMQVMSCKRMVIDNCSFIGVTPNSNNGLAEPINLDPCDWEGFRGYGEGSLSYDGTNNYDITIQNCYFASGTDTGFVGLTNAVGGHYHVSTDLYHENVKFINNFVDGATYSGLRMLDFHNSIISGNKIVSSGYAFVFGYGDKNCVYNNDLVFTGSSADSTTKAELLSASETGLSLYDNTYRRYGSRHWYFNGNDVTFIKTDPIVIAYGTFGGGTDIPLDVPYYSFDTIYVTVGYTSSDSLKTASIKCWMGDLAPDGTCPAFKKLDSGNTRIYSIDGLADGATVTFDGEDYKKIVVGGESYATRFVLGSRGV